MKSLKLTFQILFGDHFFEDLAVKFYDQFLMIGFEHFMRRHVYRSCLEVVALKKVFLTRISSF